MSRIFLIIVLFLNIFLYGEEPVRIKEEKIVVVASKFPMKEMDIGKHVIIITKEEIERSPFKTIPEILKYCSSLDLQERGSFGVQADLSLRGSTFQQVLILIDGVRVNDLQTAHHNMDIPVPAENIERIEILHGGGSSLYGADAFGGVINIITKNPERNNFFAKYGYYDFGTFSFSTSAEIKEKRFSNISSFERNASKGFMEDRDFSTFSIFNKFSLNTKSGKINFIASHGEKRFGALDFYTPKMNFPSRELTKTDLISLNFDGELRGNPFSHHIYFRYHYDRFVLNKNVPHFYTNETRNWNLGLDFILRLKSIAMGFEWVKEDFKSIKSGVHSNIRSAIFTETKMTLSKRIIANLGFRADFHETYGFTFSPDFSLTYIVSSNLKLRASAGQSFRAPSYTELYYKDPVNIGNSSLKPERGTNFEIGMDSWTLRGTEAKISFFQRNEKNLIDWIRREDKRWYAENIRKRVVRGMEISVKKEYKFLRINLSGSYFDIKAREEEDIYKYGFRIPKYQNTLSLSLVKPSYFFNLQIINKKRFDEKPYYLINGKFSKKFGSIEFFVEGTNLTNISYEEIKGVIMPGRWIGGGLQFKI